MKSRKNPLWRKVLIVVFLPVIIIIWMVGWTLTMIGSERETRPQILIRTLDNRRSSELQKDKAPLEEEAESKAKFEQEITV